MNKIRKTNDPRMNYNTGNIYVVINGKAYIPEMINMRNGFRENIEYEFSITADPRYAVENTMLSIKDVIFNDPATIVFWGDGSKTVVKCQEDEEFDPEKGLTMAFFKRMHDNKGHYFEEIKKWTKKYEEKQEIIEKAKELLRVCCGVNGNVTIHTDALDSEEPSQYESE